MVYSHMLRSSRNADFREQEGEHVGFRALGSRLEGLGFWGV